VAIHELLPAPGLIGKRQTRRLSVRRLVQDLRHELLQVRLGRKLVAVVAVLAANADDHGGWPESAKRRVSVMELSTDGHEDGETGSGRIYECRRIVYDTLYDRLQQSSQPCDL
jgi:hypothetical protein